MKEERDKFDDLFQSKLYDFEMDTMPGDWEAISGRLPDKPSVPLRRTLRYWAAAAVISLLMTMGGVYMFDRNKTMLPVAQQIKEQTDTLESQWAATFEKAETEIVTTETKHMPVTAHAPGTITNRPRMIAASQAHSVVDPVVQTESFAVLPQVEKSDQGEVAADTLNKSDESDVEAMRQPSVVTRSLVADAAPVRKAKKEAPARKWGLGMGAGGLSVGADNIVPQYVTNSTALRSESLLYMNAVSFDDRELPKTDIHHKTPVSFGLSVSRYLNNRFSLQTGLSYSFLSSEWETNGGYRGKTKQKLHFVGIPLSLSYKIAEWNRFNFYAAAGGMTEVNVAGHSTSRLFSGDKEIEKARENVRMKEWLWSVNARAGVSYPLIRFVSAFAEVGASYYFDNGSSIETIHSEKPFNVSLQLGFRLGF